MQPIALKEHGFVIQPFQPSDLLLVQRLNSQATRLSAVYALLQPRPVWATSLLSLVSMPWSTLAQTLSPTGSAPWGDLSPAQPFTYVLRQRENGLASAGFLQAQRRSRRGAAGTATLYEADILSLAPALDTPRGHPAIWKKLLSHYLHEATQQNVARVFVDVPDSPLPVQTVQQAGFVPYTKETIWRRQSLRQLSLSTGERLATVTTLQGQVRPRRRADEWDLQLLYQRTVPKPVQQAEAASLTAGHRHPLSAQGEQREERRGEERSEPEESGEALAWRRPGTCRAFVLPGEHGGLAGCVQVVQSGQGTWLRLYADTLDPNLDVVHALLRHGLHIAQRDASNLPVYLGVRDYQQGLGVLLEKYGFAPFTDRVYMVRHLLSWAREVKPASMPVLETVGQRVGKVVPTPFQPLERMPTHLPLDAHEGHPAER